MQVKKDKFLEKIVKKDYNNQIEEVLENKQFDESAKNLLLSILYKIETSYKDYKTVKRYACTKDEYIENVIDIIKNDCNMIKIAKNNSKEMEILKNRTFLVDKKAKEIICYQIERKLLYCISKINKKDEIVKDKYFIINKTLSDMINIGNNINCVETLRDFNGWSWTNVPSEIESIEHNLIYQNLNILVGNKFLNDWVKNNEYIIDYLEEFKNILEQYYGEKNSNEFIDILKKLSFLLYIKVNESQKNALKKEKKELEEFLSKIENKEQYISDISEKKKEATNKFNKLDMIINNKELLEKEYTKRNKNLPLNEKIFSIRILAEILVKEKQNILKEIETYNEQTKPQNYIKTKEELLEKLKYLKLLDIRNQDFEINQNMIKLQKIFLKCFETKIEKANTKSEIIELIYLFRYYNLLPYDNKFNISELKEINRELSSVERKVINRAVELKAILELGTDKELNYCIIKNIFNLRIIDLEELNIKISKEKDKFFLQIFDENTFEEKIQIDKDNINKKDFQVKLNKKTKLFI